MTNIGQQELHREISQRIEEALSLLDQYDPRDLISRLALDHATNNSEHFEESLQSNQIAYIEYAQSLALTRLPDLPREPAGDSVAEEFATLIRGIFALVLRDLSDQRSQEGRDDHAADIRYASMLGYLIVRGSSYEEHFFDLLRSLFGSHDTFLESHYGLSIETVISSFRSVVTQTNDKLQRYQAIISEETAEIRHQYDQFVEERRTSVSDVTAFDDDWMALPDTKSWLERLDDLLRRHRRDIFRIEPTETLSETFLDLFSAYCGENMDFLAFDRSPGWPGNNTVVERKPFVKYEDSYYCFAPPIFSHYAVDILEGLVRQADETYFSGPYEKQRAAYLENKTLEYFEALLPGARIYKQLYYRTGEGKGTKRLETDGVILFDNSIFIIEAKAGSFSVPARRGSLTRIGRDAKKLVDKAYSQAARTQEYIASSPKPKFEYENGSAALLIEDKSAYENVYLVNTTLADLGSLSARISSLQALNLLRGDVWPWSVFINNLRVISEIFDSPSQFLLFLQQRIRANDHGKFRVLSELDFMMFFIREGGLDLSREVHESYEVLVLSDYTDALDRYYDHLAGRLEAGEKPSLQLPQRLQSLITGLERLGKHGFTKVTTTLLKLGDETHEKIVERLGFVERLSKRDGKDHDVTMTFSRLSVGLTFLLRGKSATASWDRLERTFRPALRRHRVKEWMLIAISDQNGKEALDFRIYNDEPKKVGSTKVGRNEPCPCGSGIKFKRCCGKDSN